jgi:hypothetical protein
MHGLHRDGGEKIEDDRQAKDFKQVAKEAFGEGRGT